MSQKNPCDRGDREERLKTKILVGGGFRGYGGPN